jgi:hypothetical protein
VANNYVKGVPFEQAVQVAMLACKLAEIETITSPDGTWVDAEIKLDEAVSLIEKAGAALRGNRRRKFKPAE